MLENNIQKLDKIDFNDKEFEYGKLNIKPSSKNMDIIIDKINEIINKINKDK